MPTVLRYLGFRVVVYPNDHRPAHVHVIGKRREAVFDLNCPNGPAKLRENYGFSRTDARRIRTILDEFVTELCDRWKDIHG